MTLHRRMLNARLGAALPLAGCTLEIGNGKKYRGRPVGATYTLDVRDARQPDVQGDAMALPFPAATFDAIVCCETLQYVKWPRNALIEMRRVMKPGGRLILSLPDRLSAQPDERPERPSRWTRTMAMIAARVAGFHVERIAPLWPPLSVYTSGWFLDAVAMPLDPDDADRAMTVRAAVAR